jgi:hypothetical protein
MTHRSLNRYHCWIAVSQQLPRITFFKRWWMQVLRWIKLLLFRYHGYPVMSLPVTYRKEHIWYISVLQRVHLSNLLYWTSHYSTLFIWDIDRIVRKSKLNKVSTKLKLSHCTPWRRLGVRIYGSYSFLTSVLDGGDWSESRPDRALASGKGPPVPIGQEAGWAIEPAWTR